MKAAAGPTPAVREFMMSIILLFVVALAVVGVLAVVVVFVVLFGTRRGPHDD